SLTGGGLSAAMTDPVGVSARAATHLVVSAPYGVRPGLPFSITITPEDQYDNTDSSFRGSVSLALASNPTGATLGGTQTASTYFGTLYISGMSIDKAGNGYTIQASSPGVMPGTSPAFAVSNDSLVVTTQPPGLVRAGVGFG